MSEPRVQQFFLPMEAHLPGPSSLVHDSPSDSPPSSDPADLLRLIAEANAHGGYGIGDSPKTQLDRLIGGSMDVSEPFLPGVDVSAFAMPTDFTQFGDFSVAALRNSSKTLKCPKCNWHYKYQETLEIHMKEKHAEGDVKCLFCVENRPHPKLSRGETYSCGYKPYRCELCRYSTTTKGNLSIHMQSDKHLHAMQELPNSIASLGCQRTTRSPVQDGENAFVCLVCGCFSCESLQEMITHAEKDRSRPSSSDVSLSNGVFRCHLCPYNTNLKANFQLHTRTDKHLQRVQLVNHIREGSNAASALCRLGAAKSVFQVLCRPCQEILPTGGALRDHCEGVGHRTNLRQPLTIFRCRLCSFETQLKHEALGHMAVHEATTWPVDRIDLDAMAMDEDAAFGCASCGFTAKDANTLEEHARSHEEGEPCPLCNDRTTALNEHLINEHKISESAVEKLLQVHRIEPIGSSAYTFRCSRCSLAFRSESALHSHSVLHLFDQAQKCPHCSKVFNTSEKLKIHTDSEHSKSEEETRCDLCAETFSSRQQFHAHINSVRHLHEAKKQLEQGSVSLNQQVLSALQNPTSPGEKKPFRCNVCKIGYGQGATLDIHLRSVAHQSRMNKLGDLVAAKEIDPTKPILEQPGGAPQKLIRELVTEEGGQASNMMNVFNLVNMFMGQNALSMPFGANLGEPADDDVGAPKTAADLLNMLKTFGIDRITVACPELLLKLGKLTSISDDQIASICRVDCTECGQTHSSIVLLGVHYQETHSSSMPDAVLKKFCDRLLNSANDAASPLNGHDSPQAHSRDSSEPPEKRPRSGPTPPEKPDLTQMAMLGMMGGFNPFMQAAAGNPFMAPAMQDFFNPLLAQQMAQMAQSPAKRARTRISDDQLKILRQYFDINNSPSEAQIKEMSLKAGLPEKVIKHWFRNTLFKERQRDKDSPYNFSIPPQVGIDLDAYEKTGETKVVPLTPEVKAEIKSEPSSGEQKRVEATLPQINLATMMQQMQQSPFSFMDPQALMHSQLPQLQQQQPTTTGRRANRTRFTDFQLRTLQQFFDKQAYPKDDDLEILSKKLQLSPRVIVVWFQNARQKARKIYENQPNHENSDRFLRTPGCNFQCKRCNLVFQRYYELIQHQQKVCYKDDCLALANDNKGVEEGLTEDEKALAQSASSSASASTSEIKPSPADLLKLLGGGKSSTEALLKMCESANLPSTASFNKRCPFCALLFKSKTNLVEHLTMRHAQQMIFAPVDVDSLPDAEDVPVLSCSDPKDLPGVLDLSSAGQDRESLSMSPSFFGAQSDGDDATDCGDESTLASLVACATPGAARSPVSNKRYRTHLTPVQVHVMKSVFTDYKTPSMAECESLGRDIGLHKRVVQVWFQNARAKERKNRASNGENEEIFRSTATGCTLCGVDYVGRVTMQDHLFSAQHITALKGQTKNDGSTESVENGDRLKASALLKPAKSQLGAMMNGFPFQFMNGMMNPSALPVMFDQSLFGVPVAVLQVPDDVKEQIKNDMAAGHSKSRFTHDGESVSTLKDSLSSEDAACLTEDDEEVGWGCPSCSNVFQLEQHLKNHQQQFCRGSETFTLVQTHYGCSACGARCGTQREFQQHVVSAEHKARLAASSSA